MLQFALNALGIEGTLRIENATLENGWRTILKLWEHIECRCPRNECPAIDRVTPRVIDLGKPINDSFMESAVITKEELKYSSAQFRDNEELRDEIAWTRKIAFLYVMKHVLESLGLTREKVEMQQDILKREASKKYWADKAAAQSKRSIFDLTMAKQEMKKVHEDKPAATPQHRQGHL